MHVDALGTTLERVCSPLSPRTTLPSAGADVPVNVVIRAEYLAGHPAPAKELRTRQCRITQTLPVSRVLQDEGNRLCQCFDLPLDQGRRIAAQLASERG